MSGPHSKKLISVCIPVFNEEEILVDLYQRLVILARTENRYNFEFIFSDNASIDSTWSLVKGLSESDSRVKGIRFSKNFGFQNSILANYAKSSGAAAIQIDADLQDPPELISDFLRAWELGASVVYGIRVERPENVFWRIIRKFGYVLVDLMSETKIPRGAGDFRLLDRKVLDALLAQSHSNPYIRGVIASLGFKQVGIPYARVAREKGESKFPLRQVLGLGFQGIINHSTVPLRLATYLGGGVLLLSLFTSAYSLVTHFTNSNLPPGFTTTQLYLLASIGLNSLFLGIIGEYLLRIYRILRTEPVVIIDEEANL
jgi:glycosyltransferase involved in cell wall biosynthesis